MSTDQAVTESFETDDRARPSARSIVTSVATLLGIGVATYLTIVHFDTAVTISCPASGHVINCEKVTTSPQSFVFGIPVAVLGLAYFVTMFPLCLPRFWRSANRYVHLARLAMATIGMGFVFYLLYAELFEIRAICLWCTSVHFLTFVIFACVVTGWDEVRAYFD